MPEYFYCQGCRKLKLKNPRIKTNQNYCGRKKCQQARKNAWERQMLKKDPVFKKERNRQKALWRENRPGHQYQREYRQINIEYAETNRLQQRNRYQNAPKTTSENSQSKIVKTDALTSGSLIQCGLYKIVPYQTHLGRNIVKTDALIVEIRAHRGFQNVPPPQSG
jgi:hypothetical protein